MLNIKSVLTRNTDPGLVAMTGVINLLVSEAGPPPAAAAGRLGQQGPRGFAGVRAVALWALAPTFATSPTPLAEHRHHLTHTALHWPAPLQNQMESPDFLPELGTIGRMTLTGTPGLVGTRPPCAARLLCPVLPWNHWRVVVAHRCLPHAACRLGCSFRSHFIPRCLTWSRPRRPTYYCWQGCAARCGGT